MLPRYCTGTHKDTGICGSKIENKKKRNTDRPCSNLISDKHDVTGVEGTSREWRTDVLVRQLSESARRCLCQKAGGAKRYSERKKLLTLSHRTGTRSASFVYYYDAVIIAFLLDKNYFFSFIEFDHEVSVQVLRRQHDGHDWPA